MLRACALDVDISVMSGGDMVYLGDKGSALSGGQRVRVALARYIFYSLSTCTAVILNVQVGHRP